MKLLLVNRIWPMTLSLSVLKLFGFLVPGKYAKRQKVVLMCYGIFMYTYINGIYIIAQAGDLLQVWGDLSLMVNTSFLLFTNVALGMKIINVMLRGKAIQEIVDDGEKELASEENDEGVQIIRSCDRETSLHLNLYVSLSALTVLLWATSAEKSTLPLRAWYPYDTSKSPGYELTYFHQISALFCGACVNVSLDTLATTLIAICRCRLRLLNLSLNNLCTGSSGEDNQGLQTKEDIVLARLKSCVSRHQAVLKSADEIQRCFSEPILAQFSVSVVIICVTAYQLAVELHNTPRNLAKIVSMTAYLLCMILQVFLYCYQGNQLMIESTETASAAYTCPWYSCSLRFRRALLVVMVRSKRGARLTAAGLTTLSLTCFTEIVKASYTFFTVLQRVEDRQK